MTGVRRLIDRALELGAEKIIFDSSGFDNSPPGREFHFQVLDLLEPDHLVVLQQGNEMESLLRSFTHRVRPHLHRIPIAQGVIARDRSVRQAYRRSRFASYFSAATAQIFPFTGIGFHGRVPDLHDAQSFRHRLVGLCDARGFVVVLGIVEGIDLIARQLRLYAPPFDRAGVASVQFGSIFLDRAGQELIPRP